MLIPTPVNGTIVMLWNCALLFNRRAKVSLLNLESFQKIRHQEKLLIQKNKIILISILSVTFKEREEKKIMKLFVVIVATLALILTSKIFHYTVEPRSNGPASNGIPPITDTNS